MVEQGISELATQESNDLIEQMVRANKAEEPGDIIKDPILNRGVGENPMPSMLKEVTSAGYSFIYDTRTGERSVTNNNMLPTQLRKTRIDGSRVFTIYKPDIEPMRGSIKCMLHPEQPNRKEYDALGLATCPKANLRSPYEQRRHMQKRHHTEWESIQQQLVDAEKLEAKLQAQQDREFQQMLMRRLTGVDEKPPMYVSDKPAKVKKTK